MQGFLILDYAPRYAEALAALSQWVKAGLIRYREDILEGIEQAPGAIAGLYRGGNLGKPSRPHRTRKIIGSWPNFYIYGKKMDLYRN